MNALRRRSSAGPSPRWGRRSAARGHPVDVAGFSKQDLPLPDAFDDFLRAEAPDVADEHALVDIGSHQVDHFDRGPPLGLSTCAESAAVDLLPAWSPPPPLSPPPPTVRKAPGEPPVIVWNPVAGVERSRCTARSRPIVSSVTVESLDQVSRRMRRGAAQISAHGVGLRSGPAVRAVSACSSLFRAHGRRAAVRWSRWVQAGALAAADPRPRGHRLPGPAASGSGSSPSGGASTWSVLPRPSRSFRGAPFRSTPKAKDDYFGSMFTAPPWSACNTSAFIEAAVVGKRCYTVLLPEISAPTRKAALHCPLTCSYVERRPARTTSRSCAEHVAADRGARSRATPAVGDVKGGPFRRRVSCGPSGRDAVAATPAL
jgi:hypothetical protein